MSDGSFQMCDRYKKLLTSDFSAKMTSFLLFICLSMNSFIYLLIGVYGYLFVYLSVYLCIYLSINFIFQYIDLSNWMFVCLLIWLYIYFCHYYFDNPITNYLTMNTKQEYCYQTKLPCKTVKVKSISPLSIGMTCLLYEVGIKKLLMKSLELSKIFKHVSITSTYKLAVSPFMTTLHVSVSSKCQFIKT